MLCRTVFRIIMLNAYTLTIKAFFYFKKQWRSDLNPMGLKTKMSIEEFYASTCIFSENIKFWFKAYLEAELDVPEIFLQSWSWIYFMRFIIIKLIHNHSCRTLGIGQYLESIEIWN